MGQTQCREEISHLTQFENGLQDGNYYHQVYGTYVHGIFDREEVSKAVATALFEQKGLDTSEILTFDRKAYKEKQYDLLADAIRNSLDMKQIYQILEQGI